MDLLELLKIKRRLENDLKRIADLKHLLDDELDQVHSDITEATETIQSAMDSKK